MAENTGKSGFLRRTVKALMACGRVSGQDMVLKTGNGEDVDLILLFMTKGMDRSLRLIKSS